MPSLFDRWIPKLAQKDFRETINWIEASIVGVLGILLGAVIYLDTTPIQLTIPVSIVNAHTFQVDYSYLKVSPKDKVAIILFGKESHSIIIEHKRVTRDKLQFYTETPLPLNKEESPRLLIGQRSILEMLLRTKSHTDDAFMIDQTLQD